MVSIRHRQGRALLAVLAAAAVLAAGDARAAVTLRATLDQDVVHEGDPIRLTLSFSGDGEAQMPDLRPLANDFEVLGTQQSQNIMVRNGRAETRRELEVTLSPRRSGASTIPALHAGDATSEPLSLTVVDAAASNSSPRRSAASQAAASADDAPDLFVEATANETKPFVQGEVRYTVRVYDGIGIREGALTEPTAEGVRVEPIGDTRNYEKVLNGRRYMVHEREYALFPQESGDVTVPPLVLQARVADPQRGRGATRSPFDDDLFGDDVFAEMLADMRARGGFGSSLLDRMMSPGREVRVRSNPVTLSVQGRPADAPSGWFLPAHTVELSQSWEPTQPTFRVGEAVRRTVVLRADGASSQQLPKFSIPATDGIRQYAAGSEERTVPTKDGVVSELVQTVELLPTESGTFTLPAVEVKWWDVDAKTIRTATLAAQAVEVLAAPGAAPSQANAPVSATHKQAASNASVTGTTQSAASSPTGKTPAAAPGEPSDAGALRGMVSRPALVAGATSIVLLLLGVTWWIARRSRRSSTDAPLDASRAARSIPARSLVGALQQACAANDARAARGAMLDWARARWPEGSPTSTSEIARRLAHPGFAHAVKMLDDCLYAPRATSFDGAALWREFKAARKAIDGVSDPEPEPLPALYPTPRMA